MLRGCILKNTRWYAFDEYILSEYYWKRERYLRCYGVVIFAGRETKLMMNSGKSKFKRTSLDRFLNILILGVSYSLLFSQVHLNPSQIVVFLIAMCLICSILCGVWEWSIGRFFTDYLPWETWVPKPESGGNRSSSSLLFISFISYSFLRTCCFNLYYLVPQFLFVYHPSEHGRTHFTLCQVRYSQTMKTMIFIS